MNRKQELAELKGIGKILDCLWDNSYYSMGKLASDRIRKEMIYFFGENWMSDMYDFIEDPKHPRCHPEFPRPLKEIEQSKNHTNN